MDYFCITVCVGRRGGVVRDLFFGNFTKGAVSFNVFPKIHTLFNPNKIHTNLFDASVYKELSYTL